MDWIESVTKAIRYVENHLTDGLSIDDAADHVYISGSHFQFIFHVVTGLTIGEYLRNRRLSEAARDLLTPGAKIIDVAMRYQYDTQESFSKAFTRFHGVPPSKINRENARAFLPMTIDITIRGGFTMPNPFTDEFYMINWAGIEKKADAVDTYNEIVGWARRARGQNPGVFDALTEWILDDAQWGEETLRENEQVLMRGVLARFRAQNARLREALQALAPSGVVNDAVFKALDRFDAELNGSVQDETIAEAVSGVFADFTTMRRREVRRLIAGEKTGPTGTDSVTVFGYINRLKESDAQVQWALFMPDTARRQQKDFTVDSFEYKKLPALRFIGRECENYNREMARAAVFSVLDGMTEYESPFPFDLFFMHHYGLGVDVGAWHGVWGRFMKADAPVPEGFLHFDMLPYDDQKAGPPYCSQFAYARFSGDSAALHAREGYDGGAMYDVTRNIILGQGVTIPYPSKYWTAEVYPTDPDADSDAFLFSVLI